MWPFGSSSPSAAAPPPSSFLAPTETPPASTAPPPPTPAVAAPPPPTTSFGRPPAPGLSSPSAELAAQDAEADERLAAATLPPPVPSALDSTAMLIVAAGVVVATAAPSFFRMPAKSPQRSGVVLGTWAVTTYALVAHMSESFKQQEFQQWEAKRLANPSATAIPSAPLQAVGFEGGFGGQEGLQDKHATTSGEH